MRHTTIAYPEKDGLVSVTFVTLTPCRCPVTGPEQGLPNLGSIFFKMCIQAPLMAPTLKLFRPATPCFHSRRQYPSHWGLRLKATTNMTVSTFCYKRLDQGSDSDLPLYLDIHHPSWKKSDSEVTRDHRSDFLVPAVVYFHGGGLTVGNRNSWLPNWLKSQCNTTCQTWNLINHVYVEIVSLL